MRIHVTGASGSGSSTLASALSEHLGCTYLDGDCYFWVSPEPPFHLKRDPEERLKLLTADADKAGKFVLAGSIYGWGIDLEDSFDLIVFLYLSTEIRISRLRERELLRFGVVDEHFIEWAAQYDTGTREGRSLEKQLAWLDSRRCPIVLLEGDFSIEERVNKVIKYVRYLQSK